MDFFASTYSHIQPCREGSWCLGPPWRRAAIRTKPRFTNTARNSAFERRHASLLETGDEVQWLEEEKRYDEFERRRFELTVLLKRREAEMCVSNTKAQEYAVSNTDAQDPRVSNPKSKVCLPEIPLPNFDGALESWPTLKLINFSKTSGFQRSNTSDRRSRNDRSKLYLQALPSAKETAPHAHTNHGRQKWKQA